MAVPYDGIHRATRTWELSAFGKNRKVLGCRAVRLVDCATDGKRIVSYFVSCGLFVTIEGQRIVAIRDAPAETIAGFGTGNRLGL
jgi:hypothetical protein